MGLLDAVLRIHESNEPAQALRAAAEALAPAGVGALLWVDADGEPRGAWPEGTPCNCPPPFHDAPALLPRDAVVPRTDAVHGDAALVLPLKGEHAPFGALVVVGPRAPLEDDAAGWARLARALARVAERDFQRRLGEEERDTLRQRAEESEALHVLGLAANRTLDPDEVLELVARFTRTLLGAHYVTVSTSEDGRIRTVASVGLRAQERGDDPFAGRVAAAGKPLVLGASGSASGEHPFHAGEGMQVGLGVPLSLFGETFGALVIGYRRPYDVASRDTRLALTLAGHAAVAISNARLHRTLADRSRELERAYQELRWSSEAKERFFASLSHELRTPLNAILGYQSLLMDGVVGQVPETARPFLENAHRATQNLLFLVNDILDLSKIEAGKMELSMLRVGPRALVEDALSTIEPLAGQKGLELRVESPGGMPPITTDPDRVRQILLNLLSNAVKFTDSGTITVALGSWPDAAPSAEWVEIRVVDTGPGIAPESQERIFHEFEQIAGVTARGGTGLGLPISRKLARLLGGDLVVESYPGKGSTFVLRLPGGEPA